MTIQQNETEKIFKLLVGVYETKMNKHVKFCSEYVDQKLLEICSETIDKRYFIHESIENTSFDYFDEVDGISNTDTNENYADLEDTVDFIAKTMEKISASNPAFQKQVESMDEALETFASSLITDQCFKAYESLMKPFENFKGSDVQIEGLLLSARVCTIFIIFPDSKKHHFTVYRIPRSSRPSVTRSTVRLLETVMILYTFRLFPLYRQWLQTYTLG